MKSSDHKQVRILLLALAACVLALLAGVLLLLLRDAPQPSAAQVQTDAIAAIAPASVPAPDKSAVAHDELSNAGLAAQLFESETRAALEGAQTVELLILDQRSQEPVPEVDVTLADQGLPDKLRTDAKGLCTSTRAFVREKLSASISDAGTAIAVQAWSAGAEQDGRWTIAIPIGPTYPLAISAGPPIDARQWRARVRETTRTRSNAGEIQVEERRLRSLSPIDGLPDRDWSWLELRTSTTDSADPIPFVRYPRVQWQPDPKYRLVLEVASEVVGRRGLAPLKSTVGRQEPVLVDGLELVSTLVGHVAVAEGTFDDARVLLLPAKLLEAGDRTPLWYELHAGDGGVFRFENVHPGAWQLLAFARLRPVVALQVQLEPGLLEQAEPLHLGARIDKVGPATIRVKKTKPGSVSSEAPLHLEARLSAASTLALPWFFASTARSEARGMRLELLQEDLPRDVPADELDLRWIRLVSSGERMSLAATPAPVRFEVPLNSPLRAEGGGWTSMRLFSEMPREHDQRRQSDDFELTFEAGGSLLGELRASELDNCGIARRADVEWTAWRSGSRPCFGTWHGRDSSPSGKTTSQIGWVNGWGAVLWCRVDASASDDPKNKKLRALGYAGGPDADEALSSALANAPLRQVQVQADGVAAGASDREGVLRIALAQRPERLTLVAPGWHLTKLTALSPRSAAAVRYVAWFARD